jgi:methyltransferase family protein
MVRSLVLNATRPLHARLRASRCRMAVQIMEPSASMTLLDMGGAPGFGGEFDRLRSFFGHVEVVNVDPGCETQTAPNITFKVGDGCALPYPDHSFDWVFSNAVLEHVGDRTKQEQFTKEMQRVARIGYFLSTPNRHFALDPHTYLPFYHLLPDRIQKLAVPVSLGHMRKWQPLALVSAGDLRGMFPSATIVAVGPFGMNLVAYERWDGGRK